jgi:hypothetical protein
VLRKELAQKLQWAIVESRRNQGSASRERISVRIVGKDIPPTQWNGEVPLSSGSVEDISFYLSIHMRNDGIEPLTGITHIYLFAEPKSSLVPCRTKVADVFGGTWIGSGSSTLQKRPKEELEALDSFEANPIDAPDNLTKQFRLAVTVPAMPPGAVEESGFEMMFVDKVPTASGKFRIRLHSESQYHDYSFKLKIERKEVSPT